MECEATLDLTRDARTDALIARLEAYDFGTAAHSRSTAVWARRIAVQLGLTPRECNFAALCGLLHDIGKVSTPDAILLKPGPLDVREWEIMRSHPAEGARMLETIPALRDAAPIVRSHHERHDGEGYPDRLAGSRIPLTARIVSVADGYHSMISQRVYRKPYSSAEAIAVLRDGRGTQWDGNVVEAMIASVRMRDSHETRLRIVAR